MPIAAIIALAEQYGPTVIGLALKYGATVVSLVRQHGPALEAQVGPLISASAAAGTLEQDVAKLVATASGLASLLGQIGSLGDLADALGQIAPIDPGNPTPEEDRRARPDKKGGR